MQNINLPSIALIAIVVVHFLVLLLIFRGARFDRSLEFYLVSYTIFSLFSFVLLGISFSNFSIFFQLDLLNRMGLYCIAFSSVLFLLLTNKFLRTNLRIRVWWFVGSLWMIATIALFENFFRMPDIVIRTSQWYLPRQNIAIALMICCWGLFVGRSVILLVLSYRQTVHPLHRNRLKYWTIALIMYAVGTILLYVHQPLLGGTMITVGTVIMVYSALTLHLPDIRQISRWITSFALNSMMAVAVYSFIIWWLFTNNGNFSGLSFTIIAAGAGVFLALLANPALNLFQQGINRLVAGDHRTTNELLAEYSKNIANILDLNRLASTISTLVADAYESKSVSLFLVNSSLDGESYFLRQVSNETSEENNPLFIQISSKSPIAASLSHERLPLTQYDIDLAPRYKDADPSERLCFSLLHMDVFVPICVQDHWIGVIALGPKVSGDRFFKRELNTMESIADQTAVALENARLYEDLIQRNAENEELNLELTNANQELSRLDKAKSDFISIASHELRTPLTQIIGYNDIIADMVESGSVPHSMGTQMVDSVRKAARRLEEIVETMFDVSKVDTNTLDLSKAPTAIPSVIASSIDKWSKALEERKLTIMVKGLQTLPQIMADGKRLTQVFSQLIQNAIQSTPDGGQIRVTGQIVSEPSFTQSEIQFVEIIVADTGIGISNAELERVFEKFYRVGNVMLHSTGDTKFKGAGPGLGLTIARGIVEAHHGRIWAESPGYDENSYPGSQLHVLLPVTEKNTTPHPEFALLKS